MTAPEELNVDDLKRRARRRLVGAIVLALATAVFVPMLLESEPKPLGEDVTVKIPPIDEGKFVSRLNEKTKATPGKADSRPDSARASATNVESVKAEKAAAEMAKLEAPADSSASVAPKSGTAKAETPKTGATAADDAKADAAKTDGSASSAVPAPAPRRSLSDAEQKVLAAPTKAPAPAPAPQAAAPPVSNAALVPAVKATPGPSEAAAPGFSVQLGAFSDDKGANALSNKLKRAGYPAYVEPLATSKGTWWRVRVGPYPSRDAAATSRDKLKGEGYSGIVAAVK